MPIFQVSIFRLSGIRLFFRLKASDAEEAKALSYASDHIDIYSNSWGPDDKGFTVAGPGYLTKLALQNGVEKVHVACFFLTLDKAEFFPTPA